MPFEKVARNIYTEEQRAKNSQGNFEERNQEFGFALPDIKFAGTVGYRQVQILKSKRANV